MVRAGHPWIGDLPAPDKPCRSVWTRRAYLALFLLLPACAGSRIPLTAVPIPAAQALVVDFDGDGGVDQVTMDVVPRLGFFAVSVRHDGKDLTRVSGDWQEGDQLGLEWRNGAGDVRCRNWRPGVTCGYAAGGNVITRAVVVHHSRLGQMFVMPQVKRGVMPQPLRFTVGQAFEPRKR